MPLRSGLMKKPIAKKTIFAFFGHGKVQRALEMIALLAQYLVCPDVDRNNLLALLESIETLLYDAQRFSKQKMSHIAVLIKSTGGLDVLEDVLVQSNWKVRSKVEEILKDYFSYSKVDISRIRTPPPSWGPTQETNWPNLPAASLADDEAMLCYDLEALVVTKGDEW